MSSQLERAMECASLQSHSCVTYILCLLIFFFALSLPRSLSLARGRSGLQCCAVAVGRTHAVCHFNDCCDCCSLCARAFFPFCLSSNDTHVCIFILHSILMVDTCSKPALRTTEIEHKSNGPHRKEEKPTASRRNNKKINKMHEARGAR